MLASANGKHVRFLKQLTSDDEEPAFLPGGRWIVFTGKAGQGTNLYEVRVDGTGLKQLSTAGGSWPAPCANGTIAFVGGRGLYLIRAHGTRPRLIVASRSVKTPECAPNSRRIVYDYGLTVSASGGRPRAIRNVSSYPVYSPDGRFIASDYSGLTPSGDLADLVFVTRLDGRVVRSYTVGSGDGNPLGAVAWQARPRPRTH